MQMAKASGHPLTESIIMAMIHVNALEDRKVAYDVIDQLSKIIEAINDIHQQFLARGRGELDLRLSPEQRKAAAAAASFVEASPQMSAAEAGAILASRVAAVRAEEPSLPKMLARYTPKLLTKMRAREVAELGNSSFADAAVAEGRQIPNWDANKKKEVGAEFAAYLDKVKAQHGLKSTPFLAPNDDGLPIPFFSSETPTDDFCEFGYALWERLIEHCDEGEEEDCGAEDWLDGYGVGGVAARADDWKRVTNRWILQAALFEDRDIIAGPRFKLSGEKGALSPTGVAHTSHGLGAFCDVKTGTRVAQDAVSLPWEDNATVQCWGVIALIRGLPQSTLLDIIDISRPAVGILLTRLHDAGLIKTTKAAFSSGFARLTSSMRSSFCCLLGFPPRRTQPRRSPMWILDPTSRLAIIARRRARVPLATPIRRRTSIAWLKPPHQSSAS